jgi:hypothetical protein
MASRRQHQMHRLGNSQRQSQDVETDLLETTEHAQLKAGKKSLELLDVLEALLRQGTKDLNSTTVLQFQEAIQELEGQTSRLTCLPPGWETHSYMHTVGWYLRLPYHIRCAIANALNMEQAGKVARDWKEAPDIVTKLYEQYQNEDDFKRFTQRLQSAVKNYEKQRERRFLGKPDENKEDESSWRGKLGTLLDKVFLDNDDMDGMDDDDETDSMDDLFANKGRFYFSMLGRVTGRKGQGDGPTTQDLQQLLYVLEHADNQPNIFSVSEVQTIDKGYVLRGTNLKSDSTALLHAIDANFTSHNNNSSSSASYSAAQVHYLPDYFAKGFTDLVANIDVPVLVFLNKDCSTSTPSYVTVLSTMTALATISLFGVGVYGANDLITQRLIDANALQDYRNGLDWLNAQMSVDLIIPLLAIQAAHEMGHYIIAWKDKFRIGIPTLLPFWQLPFFGAWTPIVTAPKNLASLFDFAMLGSVMGLAVSAIFLYVGLQATAAASPDVAEFFPVMSVRELTRSTLGGTLVDNVLGGGSGFILLQDPSELVPLHPYAIAGFCGMMINALVLLPSGSNAGGRMALAMFGRLGNVAVTAFVWSSMLLSSWLFFEDQRDILLGALIVNSFTQKDQEIPCRDETAKVDLVRGLAGLSMWILAIFIVVPIVTSSN